MRPHRKRRTIDAYQHCGEAHLHRYLAKFDFRYNRRTALGITDSLRAADLLAMANDKRLTYRRFDEAPKRLSSWFALPGSEETEEEQKHCIGCE